MNRGTHRSVRRGAPLKARLASAVSLALDLDGGSLIDKRGNGAPTFTRATTATVTDHEGLVKSVLSGEARFGGMRRVRNLVPNSESLTAASGWTLTNCTTAGGVSDPSGGSTAFTTTATSATAYHYYTVTSVTATAGGGSFVNSIWVRRRTGTGTVKVMDTTNAAYVDITSALTTSWQRFSTGAKACIPASTSATIGLQILTSGDAVDIWHPQMESVDGQSNQNPSEYVSVGAAKRNYCTYTEQLDNAAWAATNVTKSANADLAPDTALTAELLTASAGNGTVIQDLGTIASAAFVGSIYLKRVTGSGNIQLTLDGGSTWTTVAVTSTWTRFSITQTLANPDFGVRIATNTDAVLAWGGQVEQGSTASTYFKVENVYPYHGAMVDGIAYFSYENPFVVE